MARTVTAVLDMNNENRRLFVIEALPHQHLIKTRKVARIQD